MSTQPKLKRGGLLVALLATALAFAAPAASAEPRVEATGWLASQLEPSPESDPAHCDSFSPAGIVGQTIDCLLAFEAAGFEAEADATYAYILANMDDYVGEESCEEEPASLSAGALAKLALAVEARGEDPTEAGPGDRDLIADLQCLQDEQGRFSDISEGEDFSNVFGQSMALLALRACQQLACGSPPIGIGEALEDGAGYLRGQQCAEPEPLQGAFRSPLGLNPTACNDEPPFEPENLNAVDVDSTGVATQALLAKGSEASAEAGLAALAWLAASQQEGGHWESYCDFGEPGVLFPSVNSTALAIMAYVEFGEPEPDPESAQAWLEAIVEAQPAGEEGLPACGESGSPDVRATAQGILGLYGATYPDLVGL